MRDRAGNNWTEYLLEAICLGLFMVAACACGVLLEHPDSFVHKAIPDGDVRRLLAGLAMGATAVALIYSPMGKRSGAHMNPSVTLAFLRLGKVANADAAGYVAAQFAGAVVGVAAMAWVLGARLAHPAVNYAATIPAAHRTGAAFAAEFVISFLQMGIVLGVSNSRFARFTGICAGIGVATWIYAVTPISGMSMNPARTVGSAALAVQWQGVWLYFVAPPAGMLLAVDTYQRASRRGALACAKLHHAAGYRCIFCEHAANVAQRTTKALGVSPHRELSTRPVDC